MIPLYILGIILRFGPQHGYQIKKLMEEQLEDFTQIKLPNVYYHLEKMEASGLLIAHRDRQVARPEKTVYSMGESGTEKFKELLMQTLNFKYRPNFDLDAAFYFADCLEPKFFLESLDAHVASLKKTLNTIEEHRKETIKYIPEDMWIYANIIFEHHVQHYQVELAWAEQSINKIKEGAIYGKGKND